MPRSGGAELSGWSGSGSRPSGLLRHIYRARSSSSCSPLRRRAGDQGRGLFAWARRTWSVRARPAHHGGSRSSASGSRSRPAADRVGPVVLGLLWLLLAHTRWGVLVRAATQDREMVARSASMRPSSYPVFSSALCWRSRRRAADPREPANLDLDRRSSPTPSSSPWSAAWAAFGGAFLAADPDRRGQGVLHRPRSSPSYARRGDRDHGAGAGDAALRLARQAAGHGARLRARRRRRSRRRAVGRSRPGWRCSSSCRCLPTATSPCC